MKNLNDKVWITGARGLLGQELSRIFTGGGWDLRSTGRELDISDKYACFQFAQEFRPTIIINSAGFTAVDKAEIEKDQAWQANVLGPKNLAEIAQTMNAHLVHFSTDYVFNGEKKEPYLETDAPAPLGYYGMSKLEGEKAVTAACDKYWICRVSWLYGIGKANFLSSMLEKMRKGENLKIAVDQTSVPNWTKEIAQALEKALKNAREVSGLFHFVGRGAPTRFEWIKKARDISFQLGLLKNLPNIDTGSQSDFPALSARPQYSVLDSKKSETELGIEWRFWEESLTDFIEQEMR